MALDPVCSKYTLLYKTEARRQFPADEVMSSQNRLSQEACRRPNTPIEATVKQERKKLASQHNGQTKSPINTHNKQNTGSCNVLLKHRCRVITRITATPVAPRRSPFRLFPPPSLQPTAHRSQNAARHCWQAGLTRERGEESAQASRLQRHCRKGKSKSLKYEREIRDSWRWRLTETENTSKSNFRTLSRFDSRECRTRVS